MIKKLSISNRAITQYTYNGKDKDGLRLFEKINGYLSGYYVPISTSESDMLDIKAPVFKIVYWKTNYNKI